jgi:hypothetical protein
MNARIDISSYLIHFTKGIDFDDAFANLLSIIDNRTIFGSNNLIKGGYNCVCFSEAPIDCLSNGLINSNYYSKYSPFGIIVNKEWLFRLGGRPVIYQMDKEYQILNESIRWRHMTYNPIEKPPIDFTWEREWRIQVDELYINPNDCSLILPNSDWADFLYHHYYRIQDEKIRKYKMIYNDELIAESLRENFPWQLYILYGES